MVTVTRVPTVGAERQKGICVSRHRRAHLGMSRFARRGSPALSENKDSIARQSLNQSDKTTRHPLWEGGPMVCTGPKSEIE